MATTIGEVISRVRNLIKASNQDAFITDRYLYSLIEKYGSLYMRRQDSLNRIMKFNSIFRTLPCVELIEVSTVEACCTGIKTNCTIRRTKYKIPASREGYWGPLLRAVTSLDTSEKVEITTPSLFTKIANQTNFKYNKTKYYWFIDDYLYFPNMEWDAVKIEGVFKGNITKFTCDKADECVYMHDIPVSIPDFLFAEIDAGVMKDLGFNIQIPQDQAQDNNNIAR